MRARVFPVFLALASMVAPALAQQPPTPPPSAPSKPAAARKPGEPRRDPAGQTGISPYMELIVKGQAAFVARDIPGAVTAFQDAIKLDPNNMLGFYRLGEAMLESGKPEESDSAWTTALGKKGGADLHAKVLFCLADLRERQRNWPAAKEAWTAYTTFLTNNPKAHGYPATAEERQKRIDQRIKDEKDYAAVRERIKQREEERTKEAEENAKKDTKNR
ncbi:tetratricopeptide repeat protein [Chondromyces crocatus]|uniref:Uncharacterized protein n=1 Tax=Chondromyces crocatus TaxID=52 RepID=A0A0K1ETS2_CHOCO|nr:tetratricopeptide repeat protein [Chondromyces crocatus]AKT44047.1 uncharacterized protein CMC5_082850 [Chondromyces crocatus]